MNSSKLIKEIENILNGEESEIKKIFLIFIEIKYYKKMLKLNIKLNNIELTRLKWGDKSEHVKYGLALEKEYSILKTGK